MSKGEPFSNEEMDLFLNEADPGKTGKVIYKDFIKLLMQWISNYNYENENENFNFIFML